MSMAELGALIIAAAVLVAIFGAGLIALIFDLAGTISPRFGNWWGDVQKEVAQSRVRTTAVNLNASLMAPRHHTSPTPTSEVERQHSAGAEIRTASSDLLRPNDFPHLRVDGYPDDWDYRRRWVYRRDRHRCVDCSRSGDTLQAHHVVPLFDGGSQSVDNLVTLCVGCHERRHYFISANRRARSRTAFRLSSRTLVEIVVLGATVFWLLLLLYAFFADL